MFRNRSRATVASRRRHAPLFAEAMEPRRLLAASLNGNVLQITGTNVADAYTVKLSGTNLVVQRAGEAAQSFARSAVAKIVATLGDGHDSIRIDANVNVPASLNGGAGDDTLAGSTANDTIDGGAGNDTADYSARTTAVRGFLDVTFTPDPNGTYFSPELPTVVGTAGSGGEADALANIETLVGGSGNDTLSLNDSDVNANADPFEVRAVGGAGDDFIGTYHNWNPNYYSPTTLVGDGGLGNDRFSYEGFGSVLYGGNGDDYFENVSDDAAAEVIAGAGIDTMVDSSQLGTYYVMPPELENFQSASPNVTVVGNDLDNFISVWGFGLLVNGAGGNDTIHANVDDTYYNSFGASGSLDGGDGNDSIVGTDGADSLVGGAGTDTLIGGRGNDTLLGGDGNDRLDPGAGNDYVDGGSGGGNALVYSSRNVPVTATLAATLRAVNGGHVVDRTVTASLTENGVAETDTGVNIEVLTGSNAADNLTVVANAGAWQSAGASMFRPTLIVNGGWGNDTINIRGASNTDGTIANTLKMLAFGGDGNDTLVARATTASSGQLDGGNGDDTLAYAGNAGYFTAAGGAGKDTLRIYDRSYLAPVITVTMPGDVEDATVEAGIRVDVVGNALANRISVNAPGTSIKGLGGNDTIIGTENADTLDGGEGNDSILGNGGNDLLYGYAGNDSLFGGGGLDKLYGGIGNDRLDGGLGSDSLYGEDGTDTAVRDYADAILNSIEAYA